MRAIMAAMLCVALSGCLRTSEPVFDETNSIAAGEAPEFVSFVEAWEVMKPDSESPRTLIENGNRVHVMGNLVIVEERDGAVEGNTDYYALSLVGGRPLVCLVHDEKIGVIAERNSVEIQVDRSEDMDDATPAPMLATGDKAALHAFVMDAFTNGLLMCYAPSALVGL